ncbi:hypothetical protein CK203_056676 [Vitis vinifera]|uniref:Uncharacterized protein n=1 Tax=Vitis vinifera TaxID=29760 RepID=A0A438GNU7_VITVI|nr:hypothetical protein CK203_095452 [Vitis vinifera]RVW73854.1 hypothetical protein CK203_056676 [Vitis vinifera]
MPLSQALRKLIEAGLLTALTPRPPPQPLPPHFRMDLHCAYHQGLGHETDQCTALRHAIQDLIDQGLVHLVPTPFRLFPETASVHASIVEPPISTRYSVQTPFILVPDVEEFQAPHSDDPQTPDVHLLASSSTHQDALTRALSQIRVDTTTTPEGLITMMTAGRATCIVFSDDDLPPEGSGHTRLSIYLLVVQVAEFHLSFGQWLGLNVCLLATAIAEYAPSDFGPSTQTVRAYDSTP